MQLCIYKQPKTSKKYPLRLGARKPAPATMSATLTIEISGVSHLPSTMKPDKCFRQETLSCFCVHVMAQPQQQQQADDWLLCSWTAGSHLVMSATKSISFRGRQWPRCRERQGKEERKTWSASVLALSTSADGVSSISGHRSLRNISSFLRVFDRAFSRCQINSPMTSLARLGQAEVRRRIPPRRLDLSPTVSSHSVLIAVQWILLKYLSVELEP